MKKLLALLIRKHPFDFVLAVVLGIAAGGCTAALIAAIHLGASKAPGRSPIIWFAVAAVANILAGTIAYSKVLSLANEILAALRVRLARSILSAPYAKLEKMGSPVLLAALTDDIQSIGGAANGIVTMIIAGAACAGAFGYIATLSPLVCLAVLVPVFAGGLVYRILGQQGFAIVMKAMAIRMRLMRSVSSSVSGAKELKLHAPRSAAFFSEALTPATRAMHRTLHESYRKFMWAESLYVVLFFFVTGLIFFVWPRISPDAQNKLPAVALAILFLPASVAALLSLVPIILQGGEAVARLDAFGLTLSEGPQESMTAPAANPSWKRLDLEGVSYKYKADGDREFVLGPLDLNVSPGELVFVTGGNGSGKTTLAKVLLGLYEPDQGSRSIDGRPSNDAEGLAAYRAYFSAVFVDCHVFERMYGVDRDHLDERADVYLKLLEIDTVVSIKDGVLSTSDLSMGQQKRLALLFALLQARPIFVLDEWAAEQDPTYKKTFYETVLPTLRRQGKTIILIAHDEQYQHVADRVVRMEEGQLASTPELAASALPT